MKKNDFYENIKAIDKFEDMNLKELLLKGIIQYGFNKPSAIQQRVILPLIEGRDVIAQSQSGTGKTTILSIAALQIVDTTKKRTQALVISPTRELASQTLRNIMALGTHINIKAYDCIGGLGHSVQRDIDALNSGAQIVSGTPGRIYHMLQEKHLQTKDIKLLIIDEADAMLDRGFKKQLYDIFRYLPPNTQVALFSATLPKEILDMTNQFMNEPVRILIKRDELTLEGIKQYFVPVEKEEWKLSTLTDIYETITITQAVLFVNTREKVDWLTERLRLKNFSVAAIHGEMPQPERDAITREFRDGKSRVLISTDLFGRGIDVERVALVINYDLPNDREQYIHRIGRSGRYGRKGVAINFVKSNELTILGDIEQYYATTIDEMPNNVGDYV